MRKESGRKGRGKRERRGKKGAGRDWCDLGAVSINAMCTNWQVVKAAKMDETYATSNQLEVIKDLNLGRNSAATHGE